MEDKTLIHGNGFRNKFFRYSFPGWTLSAITLIYAFVLYHINARDCRLHWEPDQCLLAWNRSFYDVIKLCMGPNTIFISLTLLMWCSLLSLVAGIILFFAFKDNQVIVSDCQIRGTAAFGSDVQLLLSAILDVTELPGHCIKLKLFSGSLLFGGISNHRDVCRMIREHITIPKSRSESTVQAASKGYSSLKLAVLCFLPFLLAELPILLAGEPSLAQAWERYWSYETYQQRFDFLSFWMAAQMETEGFWPSNLIYFAFPALLAGVFCYYAFSCQSITVTDCRVYGRAVFRSHFDFPVTQIIQVKKGYFHSVILKHSQGKIRIFLIQNRENILGALDNSMKQNTDTIISPDPQRTEECMVGAVSKKALGFLCLTPLIAFLTFMILRIYLYAGFCWHAYQDFESVRLSHFYLEYLLIYVLAGPPGRWIKGFFWLSWIAAYIYCAFHSNTFRLDSRIQGKSKSGGYLDTDFNSISGISSNSRGQLILFTDSGKFIFGYLKNRKALYSFLSEKIQSACSSIK